MAKEICKIQVRNLTDSSVVIGNVILKPRSLQPNYVLASLINKTQVRAAYRAASRDKLIDILNGIPEDVLLDALPQNELPAKSAPIKLTKVVAPPPEEPTIEVTDVPEDAGDSQLTEEEIAKMNGKELKAFIAEKELPIEGYQNLSVKELKNEVRQYFGLAIIEE